MLGDFTPGKTIVFDFNTHKADGTPITLAGTPAISVYKNSTTESTAGVTLTVDYDSRTGMHHVVIDTSLDGTFYAAGNDFRAVITAGTVDSISVVGTVVGAFSLSNRSALRPATADRTLVVDAAGLADATMVKMGPSGSATSQTARDAGAQLDAAVSTRMATYTQPTGFLAATFPTTVASTTNITAGTITTVTNLTNAPTNGDFTATMKASITTAATAATPSVTVSDKTGFKLASDGLAAVTTWTVGITGNITGNLSGSVGSVATGGITSTSFATDAISAASVSAAAVTKIQSGLSTYAGGDTAGTTTLLSRITATRAGYIDNLSGGAVMLASSYTAPPSAAAIATQVWTDLVSGSDFSTVGSAGKLLKDNIDATVSSRLASGSYSAPPSAATISTQVQTDLGTGSALTALAPAATALSTVVWTPTMAGYLDAAVSSRLASGSYTAPLDASGIRSAVGLATANLDTQLDALPTNAELATALASSDDATLAAIAALNNLSSAEAQAAAAAALVAYGVATVSSVPTADENATALLDLANGVETSLTPRQALRLMVAAMAGKVSGAGTFVVKIRNIGDTKDRITATVDADGNRTALTMDLT